MKDSPERCSIIIELGFMFHSLLVVLADIPYFKNSGYSLLLHVITNPEQFRILSKFKQVWQFLTQSKTFAINSKNWLIIYIYMKEDKGFYNIILEEDIPWEGLEAWPNQVQQFNLIATLSEKFLLQYSGRVDIAEGDNIVVKLNVNNISNIRRNTSRDTPLLQQWTQYEFL